MKYIKIYADFLKKFLKPERKLRVVFDCSDGAAGSIIKQLTTNDRRLTTYIINEKPDGNFPAHGPNPSKTGAIKQLQKAVLKNKADLGVIFDSDGDRAFFVDNFGRFVNQDVIARLLIWQLKPKKIVIDIRTGYLIKKFQIPSAKFQILISRVGHLYIKKLMRKTEADFGAERSGHYYFKKFFFADSGILAAIEVINAVSRLPYSLANFNDLLPQYYRSGEINIKIEKLKLENLLKEIERKYKNQAVHISYLDGLTMEFKDWWFNLRPSNTEPVIRLNVEAKKF